MHDKIILSYDEQHKGVTFDHGYSEEGAKAYLEAHNSLFRLKAYLKNFKDFDSDTYRGGADFSYLVDLSEIDLALRHLLLEMSIAVEHFSKVHLLYLVTEHYPDEKTYGLVEEYYRSLDPVSKEHIDSMLSSSSQSPHTCGLFDKYAYESMGKMCFNRLPIWAYLEVTSFGNFISFYRFWARQMGLKNSDKKIFYLLRTVKNARNGAAHDSLFLSELRSVNPPIEKREELLDSIKIDIQKSISPTYTATKDLLSINSIYKNQKMCEIITCFYAYKELIISTTSRRYTSFIHPYKKLPENLLELLEQFENQVSNFIEEVPDSLDYKIRPVRSIFIFLQLLLTSWFLG